MKWIPVGFIVAAMLYFFISAVHKARYDTERDHGVAGALYGKSVRALSIACLLALVALILSMAITIASKP